MHSGAQIWTGKGAKSAKNGSAHGFCSHRVLLGIRIVDLGRRRFDERRPKVPFDPSKRLTAADALKLPYLTADHHFPPAVRHLIQANCAELARHAEPPSQLRLLLQQEFAFEGRRQTDRPKGGGEKVSLPDTQIYDEFRREGGLAATRRGPPSDPGVCNASTAHVRMGSR